MPGPEMEYLNQLTAEVSSHLERIRQLEAQTTAQNLVTTVLLWALNREATSVYDPVKEILRGIQADTASQLEANKKNPPTDLGESQVSYLLQSQQAIIDHIDKVLVKDGAKPPFNPTVIQGGKA